MTVEMWNAARRQSRQFVHRGRGLAVLAPLPTLSGVVICYEPQGVSD